MADITVTVKFDSFAGIAQNGRPYVEDTATAVTAAVLATELVGNGGSFSVVLVIPDTYVGYLLDLVITQVSDGAITTKWVFTVPATSSTVEAKDKFEVRLADAIDDIELSPIVTLSPLYLRGLNPPSNLDITLLVDEVRDVSVNVFNTDGTPITEDDVSVYDSLQVEIRHGLTVVEASIIPTLSGNVLTFRSTATMSAADRTLKLILWGNGPGAVHARIATGTINVTNS